MRKTCIALLVAACAVASGAVSVSGQNNARDAGRLIDALGVRQGITVGEIGAGTGELTILMARHVGPAGHVYTTEVAEQQLARLRQAATDASLTNVTVLAAAVASTNLPDACCDAIFMRNVYHHFEQPAPINRSLFAALKPGGQVAIIDFPPGGGIEADTPAGRAGGNGFHGVKPETVARELESAGFTRVRVEEPARAQEGFLVVMRKPS